MNMKKILLILLLMICMSVSVFGFSGGNGSEFNPYLISTCSDFNEFSYSSDNYYELTNDIDCLGANITGNGGITREKHLNGNKFSVSNFHLLDYLISENMYAPTNDDTDRRLTTIKNIEISNVTVIQNSDIRSVFTALLASGNFSNIILDNIYIHNRNTSLGSNFIGLIASQIGNTDVGSSYISSYIDYYNNTYNSVHMDKIKIKNSLIEGNVAIGFVIGRVQSSIYPVLRDINVQNSNITRYSNNIYQTQNTGSGAIIGSVFNYYASIDRAVIYNTLGLEFIAYGSNYAYITATGANIYSDLEYTGRSHDNNYYQIGNVSILDVSTMNDESVYTTFNFDTIWELQDGHAQLIEQLYAPLVIDISPSSAENYGTEMTITTSGCPSELNCTLYINEVLQISPYIFTPSSGLYNLTYNSTSNDLYEYTSVIDSFTITPAVLSLSTGLSTPSPITYGTPLTITGTGCISAVTCQLFRNTTVVSNPFSDLLSAGSYIFTYNTTGNENYSAQTSSASVVVNKANPIANITLSNPSPLTYGQSTIISETCHDEITCQLYINETPIADVYNFTPGAGTYEIYLNHTANENFTTSTDTKTLIVNKASPTANISISNPSPVEFGSSTTLTHTCHAEVDCQLYLNGTEIDNGYELIGNVTTYEVYLNHTANENFTTETDTALIVFQDTTAPIFSNSNIASNSTVNSLSLFTFELSETALCNITLAKNGSTEVLLDQVTNTTNNTFTLNSTGYDLYNLTTSCVDDYANTGLLELINITYTAPAPSGGGGGGGGFIPLAPVDEVIDTTLSIISDTSTQSESAILNYLGTPLSKNQEFYRVYMVYLILLLVSEMGGFLLLKSKFTATIGIYIGLVALFVSFVIILGLDAIIGFL